MAYWAYFPTGRSEVAARPRGAPPTAEPALHCLLCDGDRLDPLWDGVADHFGVARGRFGFLRCGACGSATLDPIPDRDELARMYPPSYNFKEPPGATGPARLVALVESRLFYQPMIEARFRAARRLGGLSAGRVLEIGCGSGLFLDLLRRRGFEVEGVELSETDSAYARERLGLPVLTGALASHRMPDERYDAVLLFSVLEHLPEPLAALSEVFRILKPGAGVVLAVPLLDSPQARALGRRWYAVSEAPRHVTLPSDRGVTGLLAAAGFVGVRAAAGPLLENAGVIALSLLPRAATAAGHGHRRTIGLAAGRLAGAALVPVALVLAIIERAWSGGRRAGVTLFHGRKPG